MTDMGTLGGSKSEALVVNDKGQVVGTSDTSSGSTHAYVWENGKMTDLGTLGGSRSNAIGINENGQVVGQAYTSDEKSHACIWEYNIESTPI